MWKMCKSGRKQIRRAEKGGGKGSGKDGGKIVGKMRFAQGRAEKVRESEKCGKVSTENPHRFAQGFSQSFTQDIKHKDPPGWWKVARGAQNLV